MSMVKLSFQDQSCDLTLEEGLEEYRAYLQANGKKQLIDKPGSQIIRDHDATHVIFGLDTFTRTRIVFRSHGSFARLPVEI